jgi:hypothetical protein
MEGIRGRRPIAVRCVECCVVVCWLGWMVWVRTGLGLWLWFGCVFVLGLFDLGWLGVGLRYLWLSIGYGYRGLMVWFGLGWMVLAWVRDWALVRLWMNLRV